MQRLVVKLALQNLSIIRGSHCLITEGTSTGYSATVVGIAMIFTGENETVEVPCC